MADSYLLVPGTSGTKLMLNGADIGWPVELTVNAWLAGMGFATGLPSITRPADEIVDLLSMQFSDDDNVFQPVRSTLLDGTCTPGPALIAPYNQFLNSFLGPRFETFVYDWRSDIRGSGQLLLDHLIANRPPGGRWRIVGHSQGGLVIVAASKMLAAMAGNDDRSFSQLVSHVALVGVPLAGTVNAASAIVVGDNLAPTFSDRFRKIVRTWPAIHQLLPVWPGSARRSTAGGTIHLPFNLTSDQAWQSDPTVLAGPLTRARNARRYFFRAPLSAMNGVESAIFFSRSYPTCNHVEIDDTGVMRIPSPTEPGDSLVPEETTRRMLSDIELERVRSFGGGAGAHTMPHPFLLIDPVISTAVHDFVTA